MLLLDANLLIYSTDKDSPHHHLARTWLDQILSRGERVGLPWHSTLAYTRITSDPRIYRTPQSPAQAWAIVETWLALDNVWIPTPGPAHRQIFSGLLQNLGGGGKLIPDAHLAALAIEHGLTLCSTDGDFARFKGLRWLNPLAPA